MKKIFFLFVMMLSQTSFAQGTCEAFFQSFAKNGNRLIVSNRNASKEVARLAPYSPAEINIFLRELTKNPDRNDFIKQLHMNDLTELQNYAYLGSTSMAYATAQYRGKAVFLKKQKKERGINEGAWLWAINQLGIGLHLYGKIEINEETYLVIEYLSDSANTKFPRANFGPEIASPNQSPAHLVMTEFILMKIRNSLLFLLQAGINPMSDSQWLFTKKRAAPVDLEYYRLDNSLLIKAQDELLRLADEYIEGIREDWQNEGRYFSN